MPMLVHPDQTCAVPERDIRDALLNLYNVVQMVRLEKKHGLLFSVDHMAAFDVIEWDYVYKTLEAFGLGKFVKWIKVIYSPGRVTSAVQINGYISASFQATRGIRQGCPLSCALYVLVSETVLNFIRKDRLVRGVVIQRVEHKINSFADDTNLTLENYRSVLTLSGTGFRSASVQRSSISLSSVCRQSVAGLSAVCRRSVVGLLSVRHRSVSGPTPSSSSPAADRPRTDRGPTADRLATDRGWTADGPTTDC